MKLQNPDLKQYVLSASAITRKLPQHLSAYFNRYFRAFYRRCLIQHTGFSIKEIVEKTLQFRECDVASMPVATSRPLFEVGDDEQIACPDDEEVADLIAAVTGNRTPANAAISDGENVVDQHTNEMSDEGPTATENVPPSNHDNLLTMIAQMQSQIQRLESASRQTNVSNRALVHSFAVGNSLPPPAVPFVYHMPPPPPSQPVLEIQHVSRLPTDRQCKKCRKFASQGCPGGMGRAKCVFE